MPFCHFYHRPTLILITFCFQDHVAQQVKEQGLNDSQAALLLAQVTQEFQNNY